MKNGLVQNPLGNTINHNVLKIIFRFVINDQFLLVPFYA